MNVSEDFQDQRGKVQNGYWKHSMTWDCGERRDQRNRRGRRARALICHLYYLLVVTIPCG